MELVGFRDNSKTENKTKEPGEFVNFLINNENKDISSINMPSFESELTKNGFECINLHDSWEFNTKRDCQLIYNHYLNSLLGSKLERVIMPSMPKAEIKAAKAQSEKEKQDALNKAKLEEFRSR